MAKGENIFRRGGMVAGKLAIAKGASYLEKSSMDTAMEKHTVRPKRKQKSAKRR